MVFDDHKDLDQPGHAQSDQSLCCVLTGKNRIKEQIGKMLKVFMSMSLRFKQCHIVDVAVHPLILIKNLYKTSQ